MIRCECTSTVTSTSEKCTQYDTEYRYIQNNSPSRVSDGTNESRKKDIHGLTVSLYEWLWVTTLNALNLSVP